MVIGGCARSGTTLLLSALSCHRDLCAIPDETQLLCPGAYWPQGGRIADPDLRGLRRVLVAGPRWRTCRAWVEKTPRNVHNLERIFSSLGRDTKFLHMVRDGRDVTVSRHPQDPSEFWVEPERWVSDVTAGLAWGDHPGVLRIRYVARAGTTGDNQVGGPLASAPVRYPCREIPGPARRDHAPGEAGI